MPDVLRNRGQAGRLRPEGDPVHRGRPDQGSVRAERGVRGCRVAAGFRFPATEEPDRVIPIAGPAGTGPAIPRPGSTTSGSNPGDAPAFRLTRPG